MKIDMEQFKQIFMEECAENLQIMEQELLGFDQSSVDPETINTIFRAAHSIKGGGATFEFFDISEFTHLLETLLDEVRDGKRTLDDNSVDLLLKSVDLIRQMMLRHQGDASADVSERDTLEAQFNALLGHQQAAHANAAATTEATAAAGWQIQFEPDPEILFSGNEPLRIFRELSELGELSVEANSSRLPELSALQPEHCYLSWQLTLRGDIDKAAIDECFEWVMDECKLSITALDSATDADAASSAPQAAVTQPAAAPSAAITSAADNAAPAKATAQTGGSIRVDIDKIDSLINLVGELVITQSMLTELGNDFSMQRLEALQQGLDQLLSNTKALQESVLSIRMLPISFAFNRFPRLVRDVSMKLQKQVELKISGEHTELDKTVMEQIVDPLVHLVRNAIDHGIETPQQRQAAGKPGVGEIKLEAFHQGGNIVIEISDDGAGLNKEKLWRKAQEKGLTQRLGDDLNQVDDQQVYGLIFAPGFSTADAVSDLSGRGVGMDVVKRNITNLGGQIEIESALGKGTTFRIALPLTLAILDGQLVRVGNETFVIPLVTIIESIQLRKEQLNRVSGGVELYRLREENIPVLHLRNEFGLEADRDLDHPLLCVVEAAGHKVGLVMDELLSQQQVVIKSLESHYRKIKGISGATILGDGSVSLIIDVPGLVNHMLQRVGQNRSGRAA